MKNKLFIVFDLEATCWNKNDPDRKEHAQSEITQIGAVALLEPELEEVGTYNHYVAPTENKILSKFCTELTGITQEKIEGEEIFGHNFGYRYTHFLDWAVELAQTKQVDLDDVYFVSWGMFDKAQFEREGKRKGIDTSFLTSRHFSAKHRWAKVTNSKKLGVMGALDKLGLKFEGRLHDGYDDAVNIARIFKEIYKDVVVNYGKI